MVQLTSYLGKYWWVIIDVSDGNVHGGGVTEAGSATVPHLGGELRGFHRLKIHSTADTYNPWITTKKINLTPVQDSKE